MRQELSTSLFSITHRGRTITGRQVLRNHRQLTVQLVHPHGLLVCHLNMPAFMGACGATLIGPFGDETRERVLRLLYADAVRFRRLLPGMVQSLPPGDERTSAFMESMDEQLERAHRECPETQALPWNHPVRFRKEVQWLRHQGEWPDGRRLSLLHEDPEMEWQLLLLLHHALHQRFKVEGAWGEWVGN